MGTKYGGPILVCLCTEHTFKPYHFLRIKLSLVRIVFPQANQRQVLTFRDILAFQRGSAIALRTPEELKSLQINMIVNTPFAIPNPWWRIGHPSCSLVGSCYVQEATPLSLQCGVQGASKRWCPLDSTWILTIGKPPNSLVQVQQSINRGIVTLGWYHHITYRSNSRPVCHHPKCKKFLHGSFLLVY